MSHQEMVSNIPSLYHCTPPPAFAEKGTHGKSARVQCTAIKAIAQSDLGLAKTASRCKRSLTPEVGGLLEQYPVPDGFIHEALQMALIEHDHMVEQVPAAVADPTFDNAALPRTSEAGPLGLDAKALHGIDPRIETGTAIKDRLAGCRVVSERLSQLLNHPGAGGVPGNSVP